MSKEFDAWDKGNKSLVSGIIGGLGLLALGGIAKLISHKKNEEPEKSEKEVFRAGSYTVYKDVDDK